MAKQRRNGRSGDPRKASAPARVVPITPGNARREEIRAELAAIAYARGRLNKQLEELRIRQYQAVVDAREERLTWAEIGADLRLAAPTVCALRAPRGWVGGLP